MNEVGMDRSITVFVADDHGVVRDSLRLICQSHPHLELVGEATDGHAAVELITRLQPDVALIDVVLPGIDGFEVVRRIQRNGFQGRILILTSREDPNAVFEASVLGVHGFLRKVATLEEVGRAIEQVGGGLRVFGQEDERAAIAELGVRTKRARRASEAESNLTARQHEILLLLSDGLSTRQIASRLGISERTVESHVSSLYRKLEVGTRVQAVRRAGSLGLLDHESMDS